MMFAQQHTHSEDLSTGSLKTHGPFNALDSDNYQHAALISLTGLFYMGGGLLILMVIMDLVRKCKFLNIFSTGYKFPAISSNHTNLALHLYTDMVKQDNSDSNNMSNQ